MKRLLLDTGRRAGLWRVPAALYGRRRLTVLCYHRVTDPAAGGFVGYEGNASATPDRFSEQIEWVAQRFNPIAASDLSALSGLPPRPLLVTFDDGYRDNVAAVEVLARHGIRPLIFLATGHIGSPEPFWWDFVAEAFRRARRSPGSLPLLGATGPGDPPVREWIEAAKRLPDGERRSAVAGLEEALDPELGAGLFAGLTLDWDDVAAMAGAADFGGHTVNHPILTRVAGPDEARREIAGSVETVSAAIGEPTRWFAYPNGGREDFDDAIESLVAETGCLSAFSLMPGPARLSDVARNPLRIPRIYVHHTDDLSRFVAKVAGVPRAFRVMR